MLVMMRRIRRGDSRERGDFTGMIHADLPNSDFILRRRLQNGARKADVIVEVALSFGDAKFSTEDRSGKILRARLAVASGDRQDFERKRFPVVRGQVLIGLPECLLTRITVNLSGTFPVQVTIDNRAGGAGFDGVFNEFVSIEIFAAQGDEQFAAF